MMIRSAKAFYFFFYGAAAMLLPYLALYYQDMGLNGRQIGVLTGIVPLVMTVSSAAWGALADATQRHRLVLFVAVAGSWTAVLALWRAASYPQLLLAVVGYALFIGTVTPLVDNAVMERLPAAGAYGRVRVWGSYGWSLTAVVAGILIGRLGVWVGFVGYILLFAVLLAVARHITVAVPPSRDQFRHGLQRLLHNRDWLIFLLVGLVMGISFSVFNSYLLLHLDGMGASGTIMGLALTVAALSEVPIFLLGRRLLRWGPVRLLALAMLLVGLRSLAYSAMTAPWQVLPVSLMHGVTFGVMWSAAVAYTHQLAPAGLGATAQGIFASVMYGLGAALGGFVGGYVYEFAGSHLLFQLVGGLALTTAVFFVAANRQRLRRQPVVAAGD